MELKELIKNSEERFISYKKMLEDLNRDKASFTPGDELVEWYKALLRDNRNISESFLKKLIAERKNENEGINPPCCYPY